MTTTWRDAWRNGFAPQIGIRALVALADALRRDDECLIQNGTTTPPALQSTAGWPCEAACPIGYCKMCEGATVGEVNTFFLDACNEADKRLARATSLLLRWWDESPRHEVRLRLLEEVEAELTRQQE